MGPPRNNGSTEKGHPSPVWAEVFWMLEGKPTGAEDGVRWDTQSGLQRVHEHEDDPSVAALTAVPRAPIAGRPHGEVPRR
jgi:hypothetical protein